MSKVITNASTFAAVLIECAITNTIWELSIEPDWTWAGKDSRSFKDPHPSPLLIIDCFQGMAKAFVYKAKSKGERGDKFYESNLNPSSRGTHTYTKPKMFNILKTCSGAYFTFPLRTLELLLLLLHFFPCCRLCPWIGREGPFFSLEYLEYIFVYLNLQFGRLYFY